MLNYKTAIYICLVLTVLLITPYLGLTNAINNHPQNSFPFRQTIPLPDSAYKQDEVIVKFNDSATDSQKKSAKVESEISKTVNTMGFARSKDIELLKIKTSTSVSEAIESLENQDAVEFAEPNYIVKPSNTPNDTSFTSQWGLNNTGQTIQGTAGTADADIDAAEAWDTEKGDSSEVIVAVIDSGIDASHPDLSARLWSNTDETFGDNDDDDGNGYNDDVNGYNWAGISNYANNVIISLGDIDSYPLAQSIKGTGQSLTNIGLALQKVGSPASLTIALRSTLGGADLSSLTISASDVSTSYGEVYKALSTPVALTNGSTYYIVITPSAADASNFYYIGSNTFGYSDYETDPYTEGQQHWWTGASWNNITYASDDFYFRTNPDSYPRDNNGHGTHVSGIITASTDNSQGIAGTSHGAKIMALKAGDSSGSLYTSHQISAINYAAANGAKVINMSFGGSTESASRQAAINNAYSAGVTLFASAGNSGGTTMSYPAGSTNVISVGSTTNQDARSSFSTYNSSVDISAPGSKIYSTMPTYLVGMNSITSSGQQVYSQNYTFMSGTSMASPMAAGTAALLLSKNPSYSPYQVQSALQNYSQDLGAAGRDNQFGFGRINAYYALNGTVPSLDTSPPADPAVSSTSHQVSTKYYSNNDPVFSFISSDAAGYSYYLGTSSSSYPDTSSEGTATTKTYTDIANGSFYFHVRAVDSSNNWGSATHFKINIDTGKPKTSAPKKAKVKKGKKVRLYYKVTDLFSGNKATVIIKIKKGRKVIKTIRLGQKTINLLAYYLLKATLAPGKYKFYIYATDQAGNKQSNVARNDLIIK